MICQDQTGVVEVIPPDAMKDGTELSANRNILADVYGGDMTPTVEQMTAILNENKARHSGGGKGGRGKRKVSRPLKRWSMPIPYKFALNDRKSDSNESSNTIQPLGKT
jgi:hypothetical protein